MIIDGVKRFFESCPLLAGAEINVNYLGRGGGAYSIEALPSSPLVKRYVDGGEVRRFDFAFAAREYHDADCRQNADAALACEKLVEWIEAEAASGRLPELDGGLEAISLEALTGGYVSSSNDATARFQIQCRLIYRK